MKRFLVIQTAFIGDVILATPVFSELKRIYPESEIDVLVRKGNESLLNNNPHLHTVYSFDKKQGKLKSIFHCIRIFRSKKYDEIINLHRFASSGLMTILSGAKSTIGFDKNPFSFFYSRKMKHELNKGKHEVERNLECIQHHQAVSKKRPEIFPSQSDFDNVEYLQENLYYCFAPASVWFTKQFPENKWIELGKNLCQKAKVYLIGGHNDIEICERIKSSIHHENCFNLAGKFTFLQSAALFQKAKMNYVNDSGPLHFCSAVNAPVTAFFCSTIPEFGFGPLSDNSKIIQTEIYLSCKPCGIHGFRACPKGHFKCATTIEMKNLFSD